MITHELDRVELTKDAFQLLKNQLNNLYTIRCELRRITDPRKCLELLYVEILTNNRLSYIQRILGRYHKLEKYTELEALHLWERKKESLRNT